MSAEVKAFLAEVAKIDRGLAEIVADHLDSGLSLTTVQSMLKDSMRIVETMRSAAK